MLCNFNAGRCLSGLRSSRSRGINDEPNESKCLLIKYFYSNSNDTTYKIQFDQHNTSTLQFFTTSILIDSSFYRQLQKLYSCFISPFNGSSTYINVALGSHPGVWDLLNSSCTLHVGCCPFTQIYCTLDLLKVPAALSKRSRPTCCIC